MPPLVERDAAIISSIIGIARSCRRGVAHVSANEREVALDRLRYILHRIYAVAPDLFRRIEPLLIERFSPEDWERLRAVIARKGPPPRPAIRKRRH